MSGYLEKIVETDPYLVSKSGGVEPTVRILDTDSLQHVKVASEALEYSKGVPKEPGKTSILVLAMGASEYYGPNRNGDAFRESELIKHHHTFETNAHVFKSHVNKDPAKSIGKVLKSFYNHDMHRVELIIQLDDELCPDIVSKVRAQKDVAVSMGCRIKYDVCSICGNKAPTRAQYCKHLQYEMNDIYPDGRVVCADNPAPNFFDISVVYRPADRTGYMLKKVAFDGSGARERGALSADLAIKAASLTVLASYLNKAADIEKMVEGVGAGVNMDNDASSLSEYEKSISAKWLKTMAPRVMAAYRSLDSRTISSLSRLGLSEALSTLAAHGIYLVTPEFMELVFQKLVGIHAPERLSSRIRSLQSDMLKILSKYPEIADYLYKSSALVKHACAPISFANRAVYSIPGGVNSVRPAPTSADIAKTAGLAAVANSVYIANMLETSDSLTKEASGSGRGLDKVSNLQHRASDNPRVHPVSGIVKSSSLKALSDINLFKKDPDRYFYAVGQSLLTY